MKSLKLLSCLLIASLYIGFTSCSSDGDGKLTTPPIEELYPIIGKWKRVSSVGWKMVPGYSIYDPDRPYEWERDHTEAGDYYVTFEQTFGFDKEFYGTGYYERTKEVNPYFYPGDREGSFEWFIDEKLETKGNNRIERIFIMEATATKLVLHYGPLEEEEEEETEIPEEPEIPEEGENPQEGENKEEEKGETTRTSLEDALEYITDTFERVY